MEKEPLTPHSPNWDSPLIRLRFGRNVLRSGGNEVARCLQGVQHSRRHRTRERGWSWGVTGVLAVSGRAVGEKPGAVASGSAGDHKAM